MKKQILTYLSIMALAGCSTLPDNSSDSRPYIKKSERHRVFSEDRACEPLLKPNLQAQPCYALAPKLTHKILRQETEGFVKVQFDIDSKGVPHNFQVLEAKPKGMYETVALDSLQHWRFKALFQDGRVVAQSNITYTFEFKYD